MKRLILTLLLTAEGVLLLFRVAFSQSPNPYTFWPDVEVTEAPPEDGSSQIFFSSGQHYTAFRGDTVYVVWWEARSSTPPIGNHVLFAKSTDGGQSFGPNVRVNNLSSAFNPSMKVDTAGVVYVAYQSNADIYFSKSTNGGASFTPGVKVNDDTIPQIGQEKPAIAVNNKGQIFVGWGDQRNRPQSDPSVRNLFIASSFDSGRTFGSNVQVSDSTIPVVWGIDVFADDGCRVFAVWSSYISSLSTGVIYLARSEDSGQTFSMLSEVANFPATPFFDGGLYPSMAVGDRIGVVWEDIRLDQYTLRFAHSSNFGQTFSPSIRVDDDLDVGFQSQPMRPSLVCEDSIFYVSWNEYRRRPSDSAKVPNVWFSYLPVGDSIFAKAVDVNASDTSRSIGRGLSSISANGEGRVFVAWADNRYDQNNSIGLHVFGAVGDTNLVKGDLNLDRLLTVVDVVMELNAVFVGLGFPAPFATADGNCDGMLSPGDVVLLLNAVFVGSSFPCN